MLIDTHAHLYWESYKDDLNQVIQQSLDAGISTIINAGVDVEKSKEALRQAQGKLTNIPGLSVYCTIGLHPHEAPRYAQPRQTYHGRDINVQRDITKDIAALEQIYFSDTKKVVGIGECGLDYVEADDQIKKLQKQLFQAQIDLAKKLKLPLVIHCRDDRSQNPANTEAWDEVLEMIGNQPAVLHCYSGLPSTTLRLRSGRANLIVSFAANVTYPKNEYLREAVKILPLEKIILETDSPFLSPQSKRGQRNEPTNVKEIAQLIADLKGISFEKVGEQTTRNAKEIFNI